MLTNSEITLFRYSPDKDMYLNIGVFKAWVHLKNRLHKSDGGEERRDCFIVRIQADESVEIKNGDRIFFGNRTGGCEGLDFKTVSRVRDNRFGSIPHWTLEAEYRYI